MHTLCDFDEVPKGYKPMHKTNTFTFEILLHYEKDNIISIEYCPHDKFVCKPKQPVFCFFKNEWGMGYGR